MKRRSVWIPIALAAILALALGLRLWGLRWGLPWAFHPDEIFYVDQALDILKFGDLDPKYFKNPSLLTYLIVAGLFVGRHLGPLAPWLTSPELGGPYLLARTISAVSGTVTVWLAYSLGRALYDAWRRGTGPRHDTSPAPWSELTGIASALLMALSFLHVRDSHYGVNDVTATAFLAGSLLAAVSLIRHATWRAYVAAGLLGGLAASTKYNMGFFFVSIVAAHVASCRYVLRASLRPRPVSLLVAAGCASLVGYLAGTPFTILDWPRFQRDFLVQYGFGNSRWLGQPLEATPLLYLTSLLQGFGAPALALAGLGVALALRRSTARGAALVLLAFPAAYLAFLMPKLLFFPRFTIPLLPTLCPFAGLALVVAARSVRPAIRARLAFAGLLLLAVSQSLWNDLLQARMLVQEDTRIQANAWVQDNLPQRSRVKMEDYSLFDLATRQRTYGENVKELRFLRFDGDPEADTARSFANRGIQYLVTSSFAYERWLVDRSLKPDTTLRYERLHRSLDQRADLLAEFGPGRDGAAVPFRLDDLMTPFWDLPDYERTGPTVRVYRLLDVETKE
ncbi:MAG: glycosyltransferase family 39 protein [Chloroflexi bacterium]|nr:glycosyltransferase family 39 protein [Chloroflexota bacterium]